MIAGMTEIEEMTPHQVRAQGLTDRLALLIVREGMIVVMTGIGGMIAGMTEIEEMTEDMIETEGTIAATIEIEGMGIVATREGMIEATIAGMIAAVSATAETSMTEEVMTGERIGEVQKRRRLI